jgi:hypothetical protein
MILLGKAANFELLEIGAWNILVLCAILYLAQGGGIALYFLIRLPPFFRIIVNLAILLLLLKPGINAMLLAILVFAGILENWVPLRAQEHTKGSPPTPEA